MLRRDIDQDRRQRLHRHVYNGSRSKLRAPKLLHWCLLACNRCMDAASWSLVRFALGSHLKVLPTGPGLEACMAPTGLNIIDGEGPGVMCCCYSFMRHL